MSDFQLILAFYIYIVHVFMFYTSIVYYHNGCGLFFVLTNYSLEFVSNFFIGSTQAITLTSHLLNCSMNFSIGLCLYVLRVVLTWAMCFCFENSMSQPFEFYHYLSTICICTLVEKTLLLLGQILENSLEKIIFWNVSL